MKHRHYTQENWVRLYEELAEVTERKVKELEIKGRTVESQSMLCTDDLNFLSNAMFSIENRGGSNLVAFILGMHLAYLKGYKDATADASESINKVNEKLDKEGIH